MNTNSATSTLMKVALAQLAVGVVGQGVALKRRLPYDVSLLRMHGRPENVARDSWLLGTALSAPITMLTLQAVAAAQLTRRPTRTARTTLGVLGAAMVGGYLGERVVRLRLGGDWDAVETPTAAAGLSLAAAMAALAWRS